MGCGSFRCRKFGIFLFRLLLSLSLLTYSYLYWSTLVKSKVASNFKRVLFSVFNHKSQLRLRQTLLQSSQVVLVVALAFYFSNLECYFTLQGLSENRPLQSTEDLSRQPIWTNRFVLNIPNTKLFSEIKIYISAYTVFKYTPFYENPL